MYLENLIAQAGSFEEYVASESVCNVCDKNKIVQLPGKKCSSCRNIVCDICLEHNNEKECTYCKKESLKELDIQ